MLPHAPVDEDEVNDPSYKDTSESEITRRALLLQNFWKSDYLTALRECHRTTGNNTQAIRVGDIVQVHNEGPRVYRRLALDEKLIKGNDGLVRAAHIRTSSGKTNRPIPKLYPLEITTQEHPTEPSQEILLQNLRQQPRILTLSFDLQERQHRKHAKELLSGLINFVAPGVLRKS